MGERHFLVKSTKAPTSPSLINLKDLPGSGRVDFLARVVNASLWLSWDLRRNVFVHLILEGDPSPPVYIRFEGRKLKKVTPDERNIAIFLKKALSFAKDKEEVEFSPGIFISKRSFREVLEELNRRKLNFYLLEEKWEDVKNVTLKENSVFILGDPEGFSDEDLKLIRKYNPIEISLGKTSYLTSHCIVILNYLLDNLL